MLQRAKTLNQQLLERFTKIDKHLDSGYYLVVRSALEGVEKTITNLRNLIYLYGDCVPPE